MPITVPCTECGLPVTRPPSRFEGNVFCKKECRAAFKAKQAKQWMCIDCGVPVGRKVKRCRVCAKAFLKVRPTYERTPESKAKMSETTKDKPKPWLVGRPHSPERRAAMAASWTDERKQKASETGKRWAQNQDWLLRIARALSGENNPMWQGGIANSKYAPGFCKTLKERIRQRDGYTCQLCGRTEDELGYRLSIHHSDYDKTNHAEHNLFATCKRCNSLVNTKRDVWRAYFADLARRRQLLEDIG